MNDQLKQRADDYIALSEANGLNDESVQIIREQKAEIERLTSALESERGL